MVAHAITFESPIAKVYNILPPPISDLDEVLAVLFTALVSLLDMSFNVLLSWFKGNL
jgi:hypothetical protein